MGCDVPTSLWALWALCSPHHPWSMGPLMMLHSTPDPCVPGNQAQSPHTETGTSRGRGAVYTELSPLGQSWGHLAPAVAEQCWPSAASLSHQGRGLWPPQSQAELFGKAFPSLDTSLPIPIRPSVQPSVLGQCWGGGCMGEGV